MGNVGLLYVGAILFLNGMALLGYVKDRGAVPLNIFVGLLQVITPTYLIMTSGGDTDVIFGASGLYLFGFTYLYVAMNTIWGYDGTGIGWFSLFVSIAAIGYAVVNAVRGDYAFAVIWLLWSYLWWLFFDLFGREKPERTRFVGAVTAVEGWTTAAIPAFLLLAGQWTVLPNGVMAVIIGAVTIGAILAAKAKFPTSSGTPGESSESSPIPSTA